MKASFLDVFKNHVDVVVLRKVVSGHGDGRLTVEQSELSGLSSPDNSRA